METQRNLPHLWLRNALGSSQLERGERLQEAICWVQRVRGEPLAEKKRGERDEKGWEGAGEELGRIKEKHWSLGTRVRFYLSPY